MRRAAKRDTAERAIVAVLEQHFMTVYRLDQPVDLLVGFRGVNHLVECKTGHKGYGKGLNSNQLQFAAFWKGSPVVTLHSPDEAIEWAHKISARNK